MFLRRLYRHHRTYFFAFCGFVSCFLFLNYKWGFYATPLYEFGMFSKPYHRGDSQKLYKIFVNNRLLDMGKYSFTQRDMLLWPLEAYQAQKEKNASVLATMKNGFSKFGLAAPFSEGTYCNQINDADFTAWYTKLLEKTIGYKVHRLELYSQQYVWGDNKPESSSQPKKEMFIVTK